MPKRDKKGQFVKGNIPFDRTGIKHTEETKKKLKEKRRGKKPALGMKHSDEFKKLASERMKLQWKNGLRKPHYGHKVSDRQKKLLSKIRRGKNNPAWIDGRSKLTNQIRRCLKNREWRKAVFERDDYTCKICKIRGGYLEADHHPKEFAKIFSENNFKTIEDALKCDELWDINNGRTLCKKCHKKTKKYVNNRYR